FTITTVEELLTILPIKNDNKGENYGSIY
ncbi:TPA: HAD family hydrolase, partial [Staphylococcus aureus]|nr:HAD family hydrolase [Staphylococcus aureus]